MFHMESIRKNLLPCIVSLCRQPERQHFLLDYILETSSSKLGVEPLREILQHNVVPGDLHTAFLLSPQTQLSQFFLNELVDLSLAEWQEVDYLGDPPRETSSCVGSFPSRGSFWA